jgi:hypothetical protein
LFINCIRAVIICAHYRLFLDSISIPSLSDERHRVYVKKPECPARKSGNEWSMKVWGVSPQTFKASSLKKKLSKLDFTFLRQNALRKMC